MKLSAQPGLLRHPATPRPARAGFPGHKKGRRQHAAYHRRWFVLRGPACSSAALRAAASREAVGVIILEGCTVGWWRPPRSSPSPPCASPGRGAPHLRAGGREPGRHGGLGEGAVAGQLRLPAAGGA